jgi:alpha-beta hydrolase superfamily lysophospholipase
MKHHEGTIKSVDKTLDLYWQSWTPEGAARAVVILAHGLGEHSGRYAHVAEAFTAAGFALYGIDHRGFGRSGGARGDGTSLDHIADDLGLLVIKAKGEHPGVKAFLYGHSMGGLIALDVGLRHPEHFAGAILTGAGLKNKLPPIKIMLANLLGGLLPGMVTATGLDARLISRDPAVVAAYLTDPLVHDKASTGFGKHGFKRAGEVLAAAGKWSLPVLMMHGTADGIVPVEGTQEFFDAIPVEDKTLKLCEGFYHEVHNEPEQAEVIGEMVEWLKARV